MTTIRTIALGTSAATLALAAPAMAQTQALPTREEVRPPALESPTPPPSRLTVEGGIERAPCPLSDARFAGITVTLTMVEFDHLAPLDPALLQPAYAAYIGKTVPIAAVCDIRDAAATILRRAGYLAAVQVPPQEIQGGVLKLDVLLAKLVGLRIRGETGRSEALLASYLEKLKDGRPFNQREAERSLLLARDLPGFDIRLTLRAAGTVPGEVVGDVVVSRIPGTLSLAIQNYGTRSVGRWSGFVRGEAYDLMGAGDRLSLGVFNTFDVREQTVVQAGYDLRIGSDGLGVGGNFTYAWTRPGIGGGDPLRARTLVATIEAGYPLVRNQATTVRTAAGFDLIDQRLRFAGAPLTTDRLRVFYGRVDVAAIDRASITDTSGYSAAEPMWRLDGALEFRKGVSILGASHDCGAPPYTRCFAATPLSRIDGDPQAGLFRGAIGGEYRPAPIFTLAVHARAQAALNPLISYEEFSGGNYTIGRGYDPGAIAADSGIGVSVEARVGRGAPSGPEDLKIQPYAFVDSAWAYNRGTIPLPDRSDRLVSAGGGVRLAWGDRLRADLTVALPLQRTLLAPSREARVLFSITTRLLPWRPL